MSREEGWDVDIETCSPEQLVELAKQLAGSGHKSQLAGIQREMVVRLRKTGVTNQQIVDTLIMNLWKGDRAALVVEWSVALGISESEFERLIR